MMKQVKQPVFLTDEQKINMVKDVKSGMKKSDVATKYNVGLTTVKKYFRLADQLLDESEVTEDYCEDESVRFEVFVGSRELSVVKINGEEVTEASCSKDDSNFEEAKRNLVFDSRIGDFTKESCQKVFELISPIEKLKVLTKGAVTVDLMNNKSYITMSGCEIELPSELTLDIIKLIISEKSEVDNLVQFASRLARNPNRDVYDRLYSFVNCNSIEIDDEGYVIAYKRIKVNYKDCYTGTIDNSVGTKPEMPRFEVDSNNHKTCSRGLHVCSESYLENYTGERVIKVKVDPANFVAIPYDYNDSKARTCGYEVIEDVTKDYQHLYGILKI